SFVSIENLIGGSNNDTFVFSNGATISGTIDGMGGNNTFDLSAFTTPLIWNITGANQGNIPGVVNPMPGVVNPFLNIGNLIGGSNTDNFVFSPGATISGAINGTGGNDTLDLSAYTTALTWKVTGANLGNVLMGATNVIGSFISIENLTSGSNDDTFV